MTINSVSFALLGAGRAGAVHASSVQLNEHSKLTAVFDPRLDAAAALVQEFGGRVAESIDSVWSDPGIDAVIIATPHVTHFELASRALAEGKHVFMEKPLATSAQEGEKLALAAVRSGLAFMICQNLLFHSAVDRARELIPQMVGSVRLVEAWSVGWLDLPAWDFRRSRALAGGGAWADTGSHLLYTIEHLVGPLEHIVAVPSRSRSRLGAEDTCVASGRVAGGACVSLRVSYASQVPGSDGRWPAGWQLGFNISGSEGAVRLELLPTTRLASMHGSGSWVEHEDQTDFASSFAAALENFVHAVRHEKDPAVTAADALRTLRLIEGAIAE